MPLRGFTEAEIALQARRRLERPLLVTIWLGAMMFSLAEGNLFYLLAGSFGVVLNLIAVERRREVYVGRLWVNIAVLGALAILAMEVVGTNLPAPVALAHFMVLIQVCKLFERKTNRDYVQMLALSALTVVAGAIYSQAMWFAGALAVYTVLACYSAMILTVKRGLDSAASARLVSDPAPLSASQVAWNVIRDWPGRALAGKLASTMTWMAAAAVAVFMLLPRENAGGQSAWLIRWGLSVTGYSGEVQLGSPRRIQLSDREVMRVTYGTPDETPTDSMLYLRGKTLDYYNDSRWRRLVDRRSILRLDPSSPLLAGATVVTVSMEASLLPDMFAPLTALAWETPSGRCVPASDLTATVATEVTPGRPVAYKAHVVSEPLTDQQRAYLRDYFGPSPESLPSQTVQVPSSVAALAGQWCQDLIDQRIAAPQRKAELDLAMAQRMAGRLRSEYEYSLDLSSANPARDGVEDFLFHMKQGHCEYFASALTAMCRVLDVPARLVAGFHAEERDGETGQYVVRERDAHAWTEVYDERGGWVIVDATPAGAARFAGRGWLSKVGDLVTMLRFQWYRKIVGYDATVQRRLWNSTVALGLRVWGKAKDAGSDVGRGFVNLLVRGYIDAAVVRVSVGLGLVALALELVMIVRIRRRRARRRRATAIHASSPWGGLIFVPALLADLERIGLGGQAGRTAMETAHLASERFNLAGGDLPGLVKLYYSARWGRRRPSFEELAAARSRAEQIAKSASPSLRLRRGEFDSEGGRW